MITARILIVDDDEAIRELLKEFFQGLGYEMTTAANGSEALTMISQHDFDCIISDHVMPDMNGLELLEQLMRTGKEGPLSHDNRVSHY